MAKGFNFEQTVAPVQYVETDTSGGDGGKSGALAFGYNEAKSGDSVAVGGDSSAKSVAGDDDHGWGYPYGSGSSWADSDSRGGNADADTGDATTRGYTSANSSADGGDGGDARVFSDQDTTVNNDFRFTDSFNEDNDITYIRDSGNQDNDGVDNKGGDIEHSVVAGGDINDSFNSDDDVKIEDSYNKYHNETNIDYSDDDVYYTEIHDSYNQDNDVLDLDIAHGGINIANGLDIL